MFCFQVVDTLERYFDANKTKPSDGQMITWASELKVPFDDVHEWFYKKWKGNKKLTCNLLLLKLFSLLLVDGNHIWPTFVVKIVSFSS